MYPINMPPILTSKTPPLAPFSAPPGFATHPQRTVKCAACPNLPSLLPDQNEGGAGEGGGFPESVRNMMPKTSRDFTTYLFEKMVGIHCVRDNGVIANQ